MTTETAAGSVLIVEQGHDARVALRKLLEEQFGLTVFSSANPIEGLAVLQKIKPPTLILLSTRLPLMSFEEFLDLKSRTESVATVPVILLSETPLTSLPSGASAWVRSPVEQTELGDAILKMVVGVAKPGSPDK